MQGHTPQPGPLRTTAANVTSLRLHAAEVASCDVDIICLQDTKLSPRGGGGRRPCATFSLSGGGNVACRIPGGGGLEYPTGWGGSPHARGVHGGDTWNNILQLIVSILNVNKWGEIKCVANFLGSKKFPGAVGAQVASSNQVLTSMGWGF